MLRLIPLLLIGLAVPLFADSIRLEDGTVLHGKVLLASKREVAIQTESGIVTFDRKRVVEIKRPQASSTDPNRKGSTNAALVEPTRAWDLPPYCQASLPSTFEQVAGWKRQKKDEFGDFNGVALFQDLESGVSFSIYTAPSLPKPMVTLSDFETKLRLTLNQRPDIEESRLQRDKISGRSAIVARNLRQQLTQKRSRQSVLKRFVEWEAILLNPKGRVFWLRMRVSEEEAQRRPNYYGKIFRESFALPVNAPTQSTKPRR